MATLRDRILNNPSTLPVENVEGMGDFRRGLRNALIGAEANTALAEEASARAAGDAATADARAQRVNLLRAQQGMTPLRVGQVEDIGGVGDAIDWAQGQLGSAAGSMAAPVAGATATAGVGSLLSLAPNAGVRALGRGLRTFGTPAVPFAINAEQMKGEFYGNAKDDPTLMANTSAQDLNNTANLVGAAGGALDAILPTTVARGVAGVGLRQGLRGGGAGRIAGNSLMEGGTELAQGELGRQARGVLNPEQDTSGFASERLNEFASGAVGGAPFAAAGEMADAGWRRVGDTASRAADAAGQVAGQVVDLGQNTIERAKERGTEMFGAARGKVIDLKEQLKERTSQAKSQWEATQEEVDLIMGNPPEDMQDTEAFTQWWTQNSGRRAETIMSRLNEMATAGDEQAGAMLADIEAARNDPNDDGAYDAALDNASEHVLSSMRLSNVAQAAARSGAEAVATKAKDIMSSLGKAAWGATLGRKRNAQGGQVDTQADAALELMGNYLATATRPELTRYAVANGDKSIPNYMRRMGNELSAMAHAGVAVDGKALLHLNRMANHMVGAYGPRAMEVVRELAAMAPPQGAPLIDALVGQVETAAGRAGARATLTLRRQAADALLTALPVEAEQKLLKEGVNLRSDEGKRQLLGMVEALAMGRATPDARSALERLVGAEAVVDMIQAIQPAAQETEADATLLDGVTRETLSENGLEVTDDGDVIDGEVPSDYAERAAEKNFAKGSGPTYYGFARRPTLNNSQEARDPFGYTERLTKDQMRELIASKRDLPGRPTLFKKDEKLASGESAAQARAESMARRLGESRFDIRVRRASDVMKELGLETMKRLQLFRDYMGQEAAALEKAEGRTKEVVEMRELQRLAKDYLLDLVDGVAGGERKAAAFRTTPNERKLVAQELTDYFRSRYLVVAEPMTDQVPEELTPANLKRFASRADAAIASMEVKARNQGLTGEAKDKFVSGEMARENVLEFEPVGGKRKVLYVKADDLVKWARTQRQGSTQSDFSKADTRSETARDREYVSDLMVGVSAMVSSGGVKGLPKLGVQSFENDVPAGLVLPSGRRFVELKAPDVKATTSEEAVAEEQDRDWFVVDDSPPEESSFQAERSEEEAANRAQLRFQNRGSKSETRSARSRDTLRKLTAEERRERMTSGETREGELDAAFDDQRYRSGAQGFDPTRGRRPVAEDAARATTTPRDLSTPRKFLTELQAFADATRKLVTGAPDVLSDDPDVAGRYGAKSKRQAAGVIEARKKEFEQFTEALAGFMMDSPFTEKQDALISRLTTEIGNDLGLTSAEEAGARLGKPSGGVRKRNAQTSPIAEALEQVEGAASEALLSVGRDAAENEQVWKAVFKGSVDELTGERTAGGFDMDAARAAAEKYGLDDLTYWIGEYDRAASGARNAQTTAGGPQSTPEAQAEAREYIKRVLGPKIKVEFKKLTGYAGEWVEAENAIYISTTPAPGTMQVAYHEALHAFFSKWVSNDQNAKDVLQELADNQAVLRRVRDLIGNDPAALAQLVDGEERLAYIYQFWAAGALELPYTKPTTLLRKVAKFLRRVSGMVTDTERAVAIFEALHRGDFGKGLAPGAKAMQDAMQQGMTSRKAIRKMDRLVQRAAALTLPAESILKNSASKSAQRIGELFFVNPGDDGTGKEAGYLNAREQMSRRYVNEFSRTLDGLQESDYKAVGDYLSRGVELDDIPLEIHRNAVKNIRALLKRFRQYMVDERGVKIGDLGDKYYPRVWSLDKLMEKQAEFLKMMAAKYPERDGPTILGILTQNTASDLEVGRPQNEDGVLTPLNRSGEERVFSWMDPADAAPFLETSLVGVLTRYFHEGVRAAEYTYRFGQNGEKLQELLEKADKELHLEGRKLLRQGVLANEKAADDWHARQYRDVRESVGAMEGTLGKDISAGWRATNSWVTVYQNIRLLPLSLFASVVDPMGMIARGAEMGEAYEAFKRGITEVGRQWRDVFKEQPTKRQADEWERLAQYVGSVDAAMFENQVADMYSSVYMSPTAKKWNDTFFKLNGMEAWNRGMRIGATKAAVQFIQRHSTLPTKDSQRWLDELGLQKGDVVLDADGKLLVSVGEIAKAKGISREQAREVAHRLHAGINRWVTGAILTPNAAQRPAWSSDPHYSMFFHLKQFTYSFHQTILKRAVREGAQGNIAPMMSLFWYVPIMVGADLIKGVIQGGGELPTHMKGMDAGEWLMYGAERSGIMGLGTLGVDAQDDLASLGGPMVEQIVDAFGDPLERTAVKALPANPLYREALI